MALSNQTATYVALCLTSGVIGYWMGVGSTLPITRGGPTINDAPTVDRPNDETDDSDTEEGLAKVKAGMLEQCKMVLVVRTDLGMTKGKIAAQCGHATLACYKSMLKSNPTLLRHWEITGQAKVALQCQSEEELLTLEAIARSLNLCARSIQDAGRTQIAAGSTTVLGIGPGPVELVNEVTGKLKLL